MSSLHLREYKHFFFQHVFPDECAETSKGKVLSADEIREWTFASPNFPLKTIKSEFNELISTQNNDDKPLTLKTYVGYYSKECKTKGNGSEQEFISLALQTLGWKVKITAESDYYDYIHHVDVMFKIPGSKEEVWVDIKSMKTLRRGWATQNEFMWVELNTNGWLFGGKASVIVQQLNEGIYVLFDRQLLADYVKSVVQFHLPIVPYPEQSFLRVFIRLTKTNSNSFTSALSFVKTSEAFRFAGIQILGI
jgi:hypothetical protein